MDDKLVKVGISFGLFVQTKQAERWFRSCSSSARNRANATSCAVTLISHVNICRVSYYYLFRNSTRRRHRK